MISNQSFVPPLPLELITSVIRMIPAACTEPVQARQVMAMANDEERSEANMDDS